MITHDLRLIADAAIDKKAENVVSIDLRSLWPSSFITFCMLSEMAATWVVLDASQTTNQIGRAHV